MLILSRVCADFTDGNGRTIFSINPPDLLSFLEAPEEIRLDPLFGLMIAEGSLEAVHSVDQRKKLENDPTEGVSAEGRKRGASARKG